MNGSTINNKITQILQTNIDTLKLKLVKKICMVAGIYNQVNTNVNK